MKSLSDIELEMYMQILKLKELKLSRSKTKYMKHHFDTDHRRRCIVKLNVKVFLPSECFKYLRSSSHKNEGINQNIKQMFL